jgi:hypothetical protein
MPTCVYRHVPCEVVMCVEYFATLWTRVGLVLSLHAATIQLLNFTIFKGTVSRA